MSKQEEFLKSNLFKVLFIFVLAISVIVIFNGGYGFGQWLYRLTH